MFYKKYIPLLLSILTLLNCSKNETSPLELETEEQLEPKPEELIEPASEVYFTFNVANNLQTDKSDDWIILHDDKGNLLDFKPFEVGDSQVLEALETSLTEKITITILKYDSYSNQFGSGERYTLETFPNVEKGSHWNYKPIGIPRREEDKNGEFSVKVQNFPGIMLLGDFPDPFGTPHVSTPIQFSLYSASTNLTVDSGTRELELGTFPNFSGTEYLFSVWDKNDELKYKFFEALEGEDYITLNYDEFSPFDSQISLKLKPNKFNSFRLTGFDEKQSFKNTDIGFFIMAFENTNQSDVPIGFLDRFINYRTFYAVESSDESYTYRFLKQGNKPLAEDFIIPEKPSIVMENTSIYEFNFIVNQNYERKTNEWSSTFTNLNSENISIKWKVHSTQEKYPKMGEIPLEILNKYTNFTISDLEMTLTHLYLKSDPYPKFLFKSFGPNEQEFDVDFEERAIVWKEE